MIHFKSVHIGYDQEILHTGDLKLSKGLYVLVGKNGAGKSTLLQSISGKLATLKGKLTLNGIDPRSLGNNELAQLISYVPVRFPQLDYVRVKEYTALGKFGESSFFGSLNSDQESAIQTQLVELGIDHLANKYTSQISDGERQLTALAQALHSESKILLLDEPTAFLDYGNKELIFGFLSNLAEKSDKCIVLASHDLDLCVAHFDQYLIIDKSTKELKFIQSNDKIDLIELGFDKA